MRTPRWVQASAAAAAMLVSGGCDVGREHMLVVFTAMEGPVVEAVEDAFEAAHPDVDVRLVVLSPGDAMARLREEKGGSQADLWWGAPPRMLAAAADEGFLEAFTPSWAGDVVEGLPGGGEFWNAVSTSPFVFAFHEDHMARSRVPRDWMDLFHPRWADEVLLLDPGSDEATAFLMGAWIAREEERTGDMEAGFDWLLRLDAATEDYSTDIDRLMDRLRAGEGTIAIVPLSVLAQASGDRWPGVRYAVPESGSPWLVRGVALLAGLESRPQAEAFLEFLDGLPGSATADEADRSAFPVDYAYVSANLDEWLDRWRQDVRGLGSPLP